MKHGTIIFGGIVATIAFTLMTYVAPYMGLPPMSIPAMLAGIMKTSVAVGWVAHFMIGLIFAYVYALLFNKWLIKVNSNFVRGLVYGVIVFVFAQIVMGLIGAMGMMPPPPPPPDANMMMMVVGSFIGHLVYGGVLGIMVKKNTLATVAVA